MSRPIRSFLILIDRCFSSESDGGDGGFDRNIIITSNVVNAVKQASINKRVKNGVNA